MLSKSATWLGGEGQWLVGRVRLRVRVGVRLRVRDTLEEGHLLLETKAYY